MKSSLVLAVGFPVFLQAVTTINVVWKARMGSPFYCKKSSAHQDIFLLTVAAKMRYVVVALDALLASYHPLSSFQFDYGGRMPTAFHFDPALFEDPELLEERMAIFRDLKGVHFAIMGPGSIDVWCELSTEFGLWPNFHIFR